MLVTVIIPTYKRVDSLVRLIKKLQQQSISDEVEILVIDQNHKIFLTESLEKNVLASITLVHQTIPNVSAARNIGAIHSNGKYLLFLDDDVLPEPNFIEDGIHIMATNNISCLTPVIYNELGVEHEINHRVQVTLEDVSPTLKIISENLSAAIFFEKSSFIRTGGFDPLLFDYVKSTEDQEFFLRASARNIPIYFDHTLIIFHAEETKGGCELRMEDEFINREKFIKGWCFRYRAHNGLSLNLRIYQGFKIYRASLFNSSILSKKWSEIIRLFKSTTAAIGHSKIIITNKKHYSKGVLGVNHFKLNHNYQNIRTDVEA